MIQSANHAAATNRTLPGLFPVFNPAHCSLRFLILSDQSGTRCSHLLLYPIHLSLQCAVHLEMLFCSSRLYRVVIGHSFLTCIISSVFPPVELLLRGYFWVFLVFCVITVVCDNPRTFLKYSKQVVQHQQLCHVKNVQVYRCS